MNIIEYDYRNIMCTYIETVSVLNRDQAADIKILMSPAGNLVMSPEMRQISRDLIIM